MVLLALPPADHLLIERDRGQFVPSRRRRVMANVRAERLLKILAEPSPEQRIPGAAAQTRVVSMAGIRLGSWESARTRLVSPAQASLPRSWPTPELRIPNAAAQTRIVSKARIRLDSRKSVRSFKGIICVDISEFESYMPSHAVGSLWRVKLARSELLFARAASGQCRGGSRMNLPRSRNRRDLSGPGCPRTRLFKGIICDDISEFESHMPATQSGLSEHLS